MRRIVLDYKKTLKQLQVSDWEYQRFHVVMKFCLPILNHPLRRPALVAWMFASAAAWINGSPLAITSAAALTALPFFKVVKDDFAGKQYRQESKAVVDRVKGILTSAEGPLDASEMLAKLREILADERAYIEDWLSDPTELQDILFKHRRETVTAVFDAFESAGIALEFETKARVYRALPQPTATSTSVKRC